MSLRRLAARFVSLASSYATMLRRSSCSLVDRVALQSNARPVRRNAEPARRNALGQGPFSETPNPSLHCLQRKDGFGVLSGVQPSAGQFGAGLDGNRF